MLPCGLFVLEGAPAAVPNALRQARMAGWVLAPCAGTTPTELRIDACLAAARLVVHLREMVDSGNYGRLRATVGYLNTSPGLPSVVPDRAEMTVDLRNPNNELMAKAEADVAAFLKVLEEQQPGLRVEAKRMARTTQVPFDEGIQKAVADSAEALGLDYTYLMSGAGLDAQEMAAIAPTAMIFVPGEYDGISHNPREYSTPKACADGINVLARTIVGLANQD